jgi:CBS domain containing-hemolysin-like protein
VALNAFFVAAEFALVAVRRTRVEAMVRQGLSRAGAVQEAVTQKLEDADAKGRAALGAP